MIFLLTHRTQFVREWLAIAKDIESLVSRLPQKANKTYIVCFIFWLLLQGEKPSYSRDLFMSEHLGQAVLRSYPTDFIADC